ncbi:MAG: hypothetical protein HC874_14140 [Richelia sp. SL_2_1]|nr:hypothetical protein [Richelia sp. SL_2_1]
MTLVLNRKRKKRWYPLSYSATIWIKRILIGLGIAAMLLFLFNPTFHALVKMLATAVLNFVFELFLNTVSNA